MNLLILGGTRFLGRALVDEALLDGHEITLFNRGQSNPDLYPHIEQIHGDRNSDLAKLGRRQWDAVIDTCGYVPRAVRQSAEYLADSVEHYAFISTMSVYAEPLSSGIDERAPVGTIEDETTEEITGETYGPLKALCEQAATEAMDGRVLHVRAGLIVGPHDLSDRLTYWPVRVARGGEVLAPGSPDYGVQFIDVRDLARWILSATAARLTGPYNVTGPGRPLPLGLLLDTCRVIAGSDARFMWAEESFLVDHKVEPYTEMPLWVPAELGAFNSFNVDKALADGLIFRPFAETVRDTLEWAQGRPSDYVWRNGLSAEREASLLAAWRQTQV
ncbi:MAG: NAD-dependent epimerase/dehydratase family protein [Candidatus Promineofilum sp.]|nr:NAD-dependent epimerase/dehydratase family protein [Promineifilum sp.]